MLWGVYPEEMLSIVQEKSLKETYFKTGIFKKETQTDDLGHIFYPTPFPSPFKTNIYKFFFSLIVFSVKPSRERGDMAIEDTHPHTPPSRPPYATK